MEWMMWVIFGKKRIWLITKKKDFNRIDSIRASQKKRRDDDRRNKELQNNPDLYQLSQKPPVQGVDNDGFDQVWF